MSYGRGKSKFSRTAIMLSLIIHGIAFLTFAFVKFYNDEAVGGASVPVTFVEARTTKVLRRSVVVRPTASIEQSKAPQSQPTVQKVDTRVNYRSSSDFYLDSSTEVFSQMGSMRQETSQGQGVKNPAVNLRRGMVKEMSIDLQKSVRPSQTQMGVSGGVQLFGDKEVVLAKPEFVDAENLLQDFLNTVRRRIESNKLYPASARDAGIAGRSRVKMTILKDGTLEIVEIIESSGHKILDNAALQSVRAAAPFPPILEAVKRDKIELSVYLVFSISET